MGVKRGSKLPNIFEPWFPHREVMEGLGLLASQCKWSWPVWKFSAGNLHCLAGVVVFVLEIGVMRIGNGPSRVSMSTEWKQLTHRR